MNMSYKVGYFLGSFDPIHIGHINVAVNAINSGLVDNVVFVPAYGNPFKKEQTPFQDRVAMLSFMCRNTTFSYDPIEEDIHIVYGGDIVYTYQTLDALKERTKDFKIITTNETYNEIIKWNKGEYILQNYNFIVGRSLHLDDNINNFRTFKPEDVSFTIKNDINISSTMVRDMIKSNLNPLPFIGIDVYRYIKFNKLYND